MRSIIDIAIDGEWNSFGGDLLSFGMVSSDSHLFYGFLQHKDRRTIDIDPWVEENVMPHIEKYRVPNIGDGFVVPPTPSMNKERSIAEISRGIELFLDRYKDVHVNIIADWPEDIMWFSKLCITGPGTRIQLPEHLTFENRQDLEGLSPTVPHNAVFDAAELMRQYQESLCPTSDDVDWNTLAPDFESVKDFPVG